MLSFQENYMQTNKRLVSGMFKNSNELEKCYQSLINRGYKSEEINLIMSDKTRDQYFKNKNNIVNDNSAEGLGIGSIVGGTIGGIAGAIAAIGTVAMLPGLGIVVAGPLVAGLAGIGAGGVAGGLLGVLVGLGIPEAYVKEYEKEINAGGILMSVNAHSDEDAQLFKKEWEKYELKTEKENSKEEVF